MRRLDNRIPPPLLMLVIGALMAATPMPAALSPVWRWGLAALLFGAAAAFGIPAFRAFVRARTTINPVAIDQASSLVVSGVYRFTRNPMYVALTLLLCAWAFWLGRATAALGPLIFLLFIDRFQIRPEEAALTEKFGQAYLDYRQSVRRWL